MTHVQKPQICYAYKTGAATVLGTSYTKIPLDTAPVDDALFTFSNANDTIQVHSDGLYICRADLMYEMAEASGIGIITMKLEEGVGGFFIDIPGSFGHHTAHQDGHLDTISVTIARVLNDGDEVRMMAKNSNSSYNVYANPNGCHLSLEFIRGGL
jgi:hypothetical protein